MDFPTFSKELHRVVTQDPQLDNLPLETILDAIPRVDELADLPSGAAVLVRADLDVPVEGGKVTDMSRIEADTQTIKYCYERGWKTIMLGHIGRDKNNSLAPVRDAMSAHLGLPIELMEDWLDEGKGCLTDEFVEKVKQAPEGHIFMLENTRKYSVEQALWKVDEDNFGDVSGRMYAIAADIRDRLTPVEINEAMAASNVDFSSSAIPLLMSRTGMGFYITEEMKTYIKGARKSNFVVFSGLKINKLDDLEGIVDRGGLIRIITAGSLAMALLKGRAQLDGRDFFIGLAETDPSQKAYIEPGRIEQAKRIVQKCDGQGIDLVLPVDFVLDDGQVGKAVPEGHAQMDIGPETIALFARKVRDYIEASKAAPEPYAMFYNGVFGKFEDPRFEEGTKSFISLLKEMTAAGVSTYVGGGEGRAALLKYGSLEDATHAFTSGGTVLKSLTNKHIAFLKAMYIQNTVGREAKGETR
ncbi:MAG TPA: phosphoglycerate kinase [Blastocatellia bacterium]|jgi:phosphoglycerate kinase|nr:phosphoglycerate kinase [Blastocatellia bacterium]